MRTHLIINAAVDAHIFISANQRLHVLTLPHSGGGASSAMDDAREALVDPGGR